MKVLVRKVLVMNQQGVPYEMSPARYQLVHELKKRKYETYVFNWGKILRDENWKDIDHYANTRSSSIKELRKKIIKINPEYIIATTDNDIKILFPLLWFLKETLFIYYNLEIFTPEREQGRHQNKNALIYSISWKTGYLINKTKEIVFTKKCKLFTIQDSLRKMVSIKYFIRHPKTLLIPNSYIYIAEDCIEIGSSGMVYSGILTRFRMEPLVKQLQNLPDLALAFLGKSDQWSREQFAKLQSVNPNIELYEQSLPAKEHLELLKKYAVGVVWYDHSKDENEENIGLSSGKLFRHLSIGQPVIVSDSPGLSKIVRKYKLGIVISSMSELPNAYEDIMGNYSQYQNNIRSIYKIRFDYEKRIRPLLNEIEDLYQILN